MADPEITSDVVPEHGVPTKEVQRDLDEARGIIRAWLSAHLRAGDDVDISELSVPSATGATNETIMFDASWDEGAERVTRSLVLRLDNVHPLFLESPARLHYDVQKVLGEATEVPVPTLLGFESDGSLFGVPFYVMDRVEGRVPSDQPPFNVEGWVVDVDPGERRVMWQRFVEVMAAMHTLDDGLFPMLQRGSDGTSPLEHELDRWVRYIGWTLGDERPHPVISAATTWLREHLPDAPSGFAWGDARLSNVLFGEGGTVNAVLDWDMVSLAGGESDLAWFCVCSQYQTAITGLPQLEGIGTGRETVELWEQLVGHPPRHWDYQLVFAVYRLALVMTRVATLLAAGGMVEVAEKVSADNAAIPYLAQLLDLPWEGPDTHRWTGLDG